MSDLADFLMKRLIEDEVQIGRTRQHAQDNADGFAVTYSPPDPTEIDRPMAECEAKRRIVGVARRAITLSDDYPDDGTPKAERIHGVAQGWESALVYLALPYADHPDYQPEWKP